jgi:hypothetical protein
MLMVKGYVFADQDLGFAAELLFDRVSTTAMASKVDSATEMRMTKSKVCQGLNNHLPLEAFPHRIHSPRNTQPPHKAPANRNHPLDKAPSPTRPYHTTTLTRKTNTTARLITRATASHNRLLASNILVCSRAHQVLDLLAPPQLSKGRATYSLRQTRTDRVCIHNNTPLDPTMISGINTTHSTGSTKVLASWGTCRLQASTGSSFTVATLRRGCKAS